MMYGDFKLDYAGVTVDADVTRGADLSFELTSKKYVNYRKSLLSIVCAGIPVGPVVITPGVEIAAVFKVDGKLSLEASISYKRTVRASVLYRQGSFTADASMDPEAEDALQYSFGPKYEGGVSYGLSVGPFLGIYGKTFALNIGLDVVKKESVSAKINLIELVKANLIPSTSIKSTDFLARLDGNKWNFAGWEGFTYNQAIGLQPTAILYVMGMGMGDLELSEISFPVDSRPIFPQVKIDEKDFLSANGEYVVLTMHMPTKSLFDDEVGFYALWTNTEDSKEEYKAPFDMDDDKVALLQKGKAVDIESRCRLNKGKNYRLKVYMQLMDNTEVLLYDGKFMVESDFSVSPSDLAYNWEGGSQNVKIDKGGYDYCGAYVPDADNSWAKWISVVVGNDGTVAIAVQPNLTFQERKGMVQCWVSTKNDPQSGESKTRNVYITQEPVTGVDWNPKELSFSGDGGSQDISFNFGGFKRFGGTVHEEGHGWCGVKAANGKLTITVQPNPSKENRQCVVDAYVTNSQNPTEEDKVIMPITVFQKGGDGQAAANNVKELWGKWTFTFNASGYNQVYTVTFGKDGSYYYENVDYNKPENNFTRVGTYKVLSYEQWTPTSEGVVGLADIEESFHNSLTGKDVVRQMTVKLHNNGYLGYQNYRFTKVE